MATYTEVKQKIQQWITSNANREVTAQVMRDMLDFLSDWIQLDNLVFIYKCLTGFTFAELSQITDAQLALVQTFKCKDDGRVRNWKYVQDDTSTSNGGTVVVTSSGKRIIAYGYTDITLKMFGASGLDNFGNDDTFFLNAISVCITTGKPLYLGEGYFWLTNKYTIPTTAKIKIIGVHPEKTFLYYKGNGIMFETNVEDANGENAESPTGAQDYYIENCTIRAIGTNQVQFSTLNMIPYGTVFGYYVPNTQAIVDRRGGGAVLKNVRFKNFQDGFYGYYADFNKWDNVQFDFCVRAIYTNCNSDQALYSRLRFFACIKAIESIGSNNVEFDTIQVITCGNDTTEPIQIKSTSASFGASVNIISLKNVWVEQNGDTVTPTNDLRIDSIVKIDSTSIVEQVFFEDVKLVIPDGIGGTGNTNDRRVNYFLASNGNVKKVEIKNIVGGDKLQNGYFKVNSGSPVLEITTPTPFTSASKRILNNLGTGNPQYVITEQLSYPNYAQQFKQGESGIYRTISNNSDTNWKKLAVISIQNEGTYTGCIFKINITDVFSNFRTYQMGKEYVYTGSVTRSLAASNDNNIAVLYGDSTSGYIRILKLQNGATGVPAIFEIQYRGKVAFNSTRVQMEIISNSYCNLEFYENLPSGISSFLTEYLANTDPLTKKGSVTLVSGTKTETIFGLTSSNNCIVSLKTVSGTISDIYQAECVSNGIVFRGIKSGTVNTSDNSILSYQVIN